MANYVNVFLTDARGQSGSGISKRHWPHFLHACYLLYQQQYLRDSCDNVQGDTGNKRNNNLRGIKILRLENIANCEILKILVNPSYCETVLC